MKFFQLSYKNNKWPSALPEEFDSKDTVLFLYFSPGLELSSAWKEIKTKFPTSKLMGCSGAGEIKKDQIVDGEIVLTGVKFEKTTIEIKSITDIKGKNSEELGHQLAALFSKKNLSGLYLLSDGLAVNGTALIDGIKKVLGPEISLSGGLAGDGTNFKNTFVLVDGIPTENAITAIGFYGEKISISSFADGGWVPFGPVRTITKSEANILYEIDQKPALQLYKEFLGPEQTKKLPASALLFPIHLQSGVNHQDRNTVRTILSVDETNQSMIFAGDVPAGTKIQLMRASHENLINAAKNVSTAHSSAINQPSEILSLVVSCVGRRLVLGENTETELEVVFNNLPHNNTMQTGFYSYGEIAAGEARSCDLHNQTMTLTLIQEK